MNKKMETGIALPSDVSEEKEKEAERKEAERKEKERKEAEKKERERKKRERKEEKRKKKEQKKKEKKEQKEWERNELKKERQKDRSMGWKGTIIKFIIALAVPFGLSAFVYHEGVGLLDGVEPLLPNVAYTEDVHIYNTKVPYFVSLVPIEELYIQDNAENLKMIFMPFGAESIEYHIEMKSVDIPEQAKSVALNCAKLTSLDIPDGVVSLELYNIPSGLTELDIPDSVQFLTLDNVSDELAKNLDLPSGLVSFYLGTTDYMDEEEPITNAGFKDLKLPDSLRYLKINDCNLLTEIEINTSLDGLYISGWDGLRSIIITGDVENAYLGEVYREGVDEEGEEYGYSVRLPLDQLTITGNVGCFYGGAVEKCVFENGPENLYMEYTGAEPFSLPQNIKNLYLYVNEYENPDVGNAINSFTYPEDVKNVMISRYDAENNAWHGEAVVGTWDGVNAATCYCAENAWPEEALNEAISVQTQ